MTSRRRCGSLDMGTVAGAIHQVGAAAQGAPTCNGCTFWLVEDGMVPLEALRERYLAAVG